MEKMLKFKFQRGNLRKQFSTLKMLISIKAFSGIFMIMAILKRIEISKKIFIIDIEQGQEVFIPGDLQQNKLPMTFRYFDPILQYIQESISKEKKQYFALKTSFNLEQMRDRDFIAKTSRKIIGLDDNGVDKKLVNKYSKISHNDVEDTINHMDSVHALSLQRSDYVCVEHKQSKIGNLLKADRSKEKPWDDNDAQLNMRFCHETEVNKIRQKQLIFKEKYLLKHWFISKNGAKLDLMEKVKGYIYDNIDQLYDNSLGSSKKGN